MHRLGRSNRFRLLCWSIIGSLQQWNSLDNNQVQFGMRSILDSTCCMDQNGRPMKGRLWYMRPVATTTCPIHIYRLMWFLPFDACTRTAPQNLPCSMSYMNVAAFAPQFPQFLDDGGERMLARFWMPLAKGMQIHTSSNVRRYTWGYFTWRFCRTELLLFWRLEQGALTCGQIDVCVTGKEQ